MALEPPQKRSSINSSAMSDDRRGLKNLGEERCLGDEGGERKIMIASGRPEGARMNNYECTRMYFYF